MQEKGILGLLWSKHRAGFVGVGAVYPGCLQRRAGSMHSWGSGGEGFRAGSSPLPSGFEGGGWGLEFLGPWRIKLSPTEGVASVSFSPPTVMALGDPGLTPLLGDLP